MARKKHKSSGAETLVRAVAKLPWWWGVALAPVAYFALHQLALAPVQLNMQPGQVGATAVRTMIRSLASIAQYLLPLLCLAGAGLSAWRRRDRRALLDNAAQLPGAAVLDGMSWQQFEQLVGEAFRGKGYTVAETGGGGADGGVDLVLSRGRERFLVQCKQWRAYKVGVDVVRELYGVMAARGAAGGFVVTSGRYTAEATEFARGRNVTLIDGTHLAAWIQSARAPAATGSHQNGQPARPSAEPVSTAASAPACPSCARPMVKRVARRGGSVGAEFWGCTGYPSCKGTRPVA